MRSAPRIAGGGGGGDGEDLTGSDGATEVGHSGVAVWETGNTVIIIIYL